MNNILAAFILLTRLPFWRIKEVPTDSFKHIVPYWPLVGWLTGGIMVTTLWLTAQVLPLPTAWGSYCEPPARQRMFARRWSGRFLRWFWRRKDTRAYTFHHERFSYWQLRSHRTDLLFPAFMAITSSSAPQPLYPCILRRLLEQMLRFSDCQLLTLRP